MKKYERVPWGPAFTVLCVSLWLIAGGRPSILAHSGAVLPLPLTMGPVPTIDGTIDTANWGPERTGAGPGCNAARLYTVRSSTTLYIGVDVPELVDEPGDTLLLFFDPNNSGGAAPAADDRALRVVGFPMSGSSPTTAELYSGTGTAWGGSPAGFMQVRHARTGTGDAARLSVEVAMPFATPPVGFALFYKSDTAQDCNVDGDFAESAFQWPSAVTVAPGADNQAGINVPSQWGDLGTADLTGTFSVTTTASATFAGWAATENAKSLIGDFDGDAKADIALTGPSGWGSVPVAFSNGNGTFRITNRGVVNLASWAATAGVQVLTGDFNGDGKTDIALTGPSAWTTIPVAFSNGDGTFIVTNYGVPYAPGWAATANVKVVAADINADGKTDIALTGGAGWTSLPVAFSNGDGTFNVTNLPIANFGTWAAAADVKVVPGDFNGDKRTDIALTGVPGWTSIPVAFSNANGTFNVTNQFVGDFGAWSATAGAQPLAGDFNADGKTDIALTGASGWSTLPVAFSNGSGGFSISNQPIGDFASWAANFRRPIFDLITATGSFMKAPLQPAVQAAVQPAVRTATAVRAGTAIVDPRFAEPRIAEPKIAVPIRTFSVTPTRLTGDFNGDGRADIALTGVSGWSTLPMAFSNGDGTFRVTNQPIVDFASLSVAANVLPGDFNGDKKADIALTGRAGSTAVPVAISMSPAP